MWVAKLKLYHKDCPIVNRAVKFGISVLSYPRTPYSRKGKRYGSSVCKFIGYEEENKKKFLEDLKKDPQIQLLDVSEDIFVYEYYLGEKGQHVMLYFDPELVLVKPTVNSLDGHEYWEVGSWNRNKIELFIKNVSKHMDSHELMRIGQTTHVDMYFPSIKPKLSVAQEKALLLAYQWGYYEYPHKTNLRTLAQKAGVSLSTFQENLRKAEHKLLPLLIERVIKPEEK